MKKMEGGGVGVGGGKAIKLREKTENGRHKDVLNKRKQVNANNESKN